VVLPPLAGKYFIAKMRTFNLLSDIRMNNSQCFAGCCGGLCVIVSFLEGVHRKFPASSHPKVIGVSEPFDVLPIAKNRKMRGQQRRETHPFYLC
jgi:hypothetical protein